MPIVEFKYKVNIKKIALIGLLEHDENSFIIYKTLHESLFND